MHFCGGRVGQVLVDVHADGEMPASQAASRAPLPVPPATWKSDVDALLLDELVAEGLAAGRVAVGLDQVAGREEGGLDLDVGLEGLGAEDVALQVASRRPGCC